MLFNYKKNKDRSLLYLHGEAASSSIESAGIAYQSPSLISAGGSAKEIALLSALTNLIFAILLVKLPSFIKSGDSLKKGTWILALVAALAWIPLIFVSLACNPVSPLLLILLWIISLIPTLMVAPLRDKWMADLVPVSRMGRYFGLRQIISAGTYLTSFYLMGYLLDTYKANNTDGYLYIFAFACIGSLVSLVFYLIMRTSVNTEPDTNRFGVLDFLRDTRHNDMGGFMVYVTLLIFASSISGAFFNVYMLRDLHFSYQIFTLVISTEFLARIISLSFWGKIVDNAGAIRVLRIISFMIPVVPVLWLFSDNVGYLCAVQVFSGIFWAAFDLTTQTHLCSASPPAKLLHYIVYQRCIITVASAIGPLLGANLLNYIFPVFGNPILGIFLLSGVLRFAVVVSLSTRLKNSEYSSSCETTEYSTIVLRPVQVPVQVTSNQHLAFNRKLTSRMIKPKNEPVRSGLLYHPEVWINNVKIYPSVDCKRINYEYPFVLKTENLNYRINQAYDIKSDKSSISDIKVRRLSRSALSVA